MRLEDIDHQAAYAWNPDLLPLWNDLKRKKFDGEELTVQERYALEWITYSHMNFLFRKLM